MTWGEIRHLLQLGAPTVPLDILDSAIRNRYDQVLRSGEWQGVKLTGTLTTVAAYESTTDTVTLTVGSTSVTGSGTAWNSTLIGRRFYRPGDRAVYTVSAVPGATSITLDRAYEGISGDDAGTVYSAAAYVLMQHIYALPAAAGGLLRVLDPETGEPLDERSDAELDAEVGPRTLIGTPGVWALRDDTAAGLHQIEFYPPPSQARAYPISYLRSDYTWDGSSTTTSPVGWVTEAVLLAGARADVCMYRAGVAETEAAAASCMRQAQMHEAKFNEELARILRQEYQQRRKAPTLRMDSQFTRHRLERATRGCSVRRLP